ncbi:hypothetical protein BGZ97_012530, partial [Linnemannia gamsii]
MPSIRLTLVNNAKQTQKSAVILKVDDTSDPLADILTLAKNKLRLKKAKTLYLNHGIELADPSWLKNGKVAQDSLIYVSCGEGYVGQTRQEPSTLTAASSTPSSGTQEGNKTATTTSTFPDDNNNSTASTAVDLDFESLLINSEVSATISILAKKSFVDPEANAQLNRTAMLPGMRKVVGQPDLHP